MARDAEGLDEEDGRRPREGAPLTGALSRHVFRRAARPAAAALFVGLVLAGGTANGRDDGASGGATPDSIATSAQTEAVRSALEWIAGKQQPGGMWGDAQNTQVADTALSLMALMAGGNTLGPGVPNREGLVSEPTKRGPYALQVEKGIRWLAQLALSDRPQWPAGYIGGCDELSKMHGHGYGMLALATACGNLGASRIEVINERIKQGLAPNDLPYADKVRYGLERAVRLTERVQDKDQGGWSYEPRESGHEGSMTVTQITALRAAMAAGVAINGTVMKKAVDYVRRSQNKTTQDGAGGFAYQVDKKERVTYALTAAALTTFFGLGRYGDEPGDKEVIEQGLQFMDRKFEDEAFDSSRRWYYYQLFYGVQALYLSGDRRRVEMYWPRIREELIKRQLRDGSFSVRVDPDRSSEYCTAMGCLTLEVPMETLPIFQRR